MSSRLDYLVTRQAGARAAYAGASRRHRQQGEARRQLVQATAAVLRQEIEDAKAKARRAAKPGSLAGDLFTLCNS